MLTLAESPHAPARLLLHVDLDCFFVSVERVLNPSLSQRPILVGGASDQRGVVASASREARACGARAGMPMGIAQRLCPDAVVLPGRGRLYARAAAAAQRILREFSPRVERASIDEANLDLSELLVEGRGAQAMSVGAAIQRALADRLGLPSSIGIATNKLVAKVACQRAKPEGIVEVWAGYERAFLAPLPIEDLPGVGTVMAERLRLFGLHRIGDLARVEAPLLESMFGAAGRHLSERARGIDEAPVEVESAPQSVSVERTFPRDVTASQALVAALYEMGDAVAARLDRAGLRGRTVTLKVRTADFRTITRARTLSAATRHPSEIAGTACFLLKEAVQGPVRLLGVGVTQLSDDAAAQPALVEDPAVEQLREAAPDELPVLSGPVLSTVAAPQRRRPRLVVRWHAGATDQETPVEAI